MLELSTKVIRPELPPLYYASAPSVPALWLHATPRTRAKEQHRILPSPEAGPGPGPSCGAGPRAHFAGVPADRRLAAPGALTDRIIGAFQELVFRNTLTLGTLDITKPSQEPEKLESKSKVGC
jgi:hypothetical protein